MTQNLENVFQLDFDNDHEPDTETQFDATQVVDTRQNPHLNLEPPPEQAPTEISLDLNNNSNQPQTQDSSQDQTQLAAIPSTDQTPDHTGTANLEQSFAFTQNNAPSPWTNNHVNTSTTTTSALATSSRSKTRWVLIFGLVVCSLVLYLVFMDPSFDDDGPDLNSYLTASMNTRPTPKQTNNTASPKPSTSSPNPLDTAFNSNNTTAFDPQNPYWALPNPKVDIDTSKLPALSDRQRQIWLQGLHHRFSYQRFKTIKEIRNHKHQGGEELLQNGLKDKKFWHRMNALFGLADYGVTFNTTDVEKTIGSVHPSLISRFLKRYQYRSTQGERYTLRLLLRISPPQDRLVILRALSRTNHPLNLIYFYAALYDPDYRVQTFARNRLRAYQLTSEQQQQLDHILKGTEPYPASWLTTSAEEVKLQPILRRNMDAPGTDTEPAMDTPVIEEIIIQPPDNQPQDDGFGDLNPIQVSIGLPQKRP